MVSLRSGNGLVFGRFYDQAQPPGYCSVLGPSLYGCHPHPANGHFFLFATSRSTRARRWHPTADRPPGFGVRRPCAIPAPLIPLNSISVCKVEECNTEGT